MSSSAIRLGQYFPLDSLSACGIAVRTVLPYRERCPRCNHNSLCVENDHGHGGLWIYCRNDACGFMGSPIEWAQIHLGCLLRKALEQLVQASGRPLKAVLTDQNMQGYKVLQEQDGRLAEHLELWRTSPAGRMPSDSEELLSSAELRGSMTPSEWKMLYAPLVGVATRRDLETIPFVESVLTVPSVGKRALEPLLLFYWQDAPGRTHAITALTKRGEAFQVLPNGDPSEAGLMHLDALQMEEEWVFGISDARLALDLNRTHLHSHPTRLPLVVWRPGTRTTWKYVRARKVVIWEPETTWQSFVHARLVANGRVALSRGKPPRGIMPGVFLSGLRNDSLPWPEALRDSLLGLGHSEIVEWCRQLQLSRGEWDRVLAICNPQQRGRLQNYALEQSIDRAVDFGRDRVVERGGAWILQSGGQEITITDAPIHISRIIHHTPTRRTLFSGTVLYRNIAIPFHADEDLLRTDTPKYVRELAMRGGYGYPTFNTRIRTDLVDLAVQFSSPQVIADHGRAGWDPINERWTFPMVVIDSNGATTGMTTLTPIETLPGGNLRGAPYVDRVTSFIADNDTSAAFWALGACIVFNMAATPLMAAVRPICVVGHNYSSIGGVAMQAWKRLLSPLEHTLTHRNPSLSTLSAMQAEHDIPLWLQFDDERAVNMAQWLSDAVSPKNIVSLISMRMAVGLSITTDWNCVVTPAGNPDPIAYASSMVPRLLEALLRNRPKTPITSVIEMLDYIRDWLIQQPTARPGWHELVERVMSRAGEFLRSGHPLRIRRSGARAAALLFQLLDDGVIRIDRSPRSADPLIMADNSLILRPDRLTTLLRRNSLPNLGPQEWSGLLTQEGLVSQADDPDAIRLDIATWEQHRQRWNDQRRIRLPSIPVTAASGKASARVTRK